MTLLRLNLPGKDKVTNSAEFVKGIDEKIHEEQKQFIWKRQNDLDQAKVVYSRLVGGVSPKADRAVFTFGSSTNDDLKVGMSSRIYICIYITRTTFDSRILCTWCSLSKDA